MQATERTTGIFQATRTEPSIFELERQGDTIIVTPTRDLPELAYQQIEEGGEDILRLLDAHQESGFRLPEV